MSVDLSELVDPLKREVASPGEFDGVFPSSTDDILVGYLQDAFWEARLEGLTALTAYNETDAIVTPVTGSTDLSRDLQQLLVFFAGFRIVIAALRNQKTLFRAKAGPTEYETQVSATTLKEILLTLKEKRNILLTRLSDLGAIPSYYADMIQVRDESLFFGDTYWIN